MIEVMYMHKSIVKDMYDKSITYYRDRLTLLNATLFSIFQRGNNVLFNYFTV